MKALILAGGFGSRLSEYTDLVPKPMVPIGGKPILLHIMNWYSLYGVTDFVLALGYKSEVIKSYFRSLHSSSADFTINLATGSVHYHSPSIYNWNVTLVDTGLETMTGGRIKRCKPFLGDSTFFLTYGDGLANVNIDSLLRHHRHSQAALTLTAVRPLARFGHLELCDTSSQVSSFSEKSQTSQGWINGGFFVAEPLIFDYLKDDTTVFEQEPLQRLAAESQLSAYRHTSFWHCMDTKRDKESLEHLYQSGNAPWLNRSDI